ncbi:MAG: DEAD/DEAH box helicase family protein [Eubacterium sp.]|nr:DEAD/DEAH box helicase family protein [Eubacterium sp.]
MGWKYLFSQTVLQRGRQYQNRGAVRNLVKNGDVYKARVWGRALYSVAIRIHEDGYVQSMTCNCPFAHDGNNCKHMAAVLFEIGKNNADAINGEKNRVYPFRSPENRNEDYYYFDLGRMTSRLVFYDSKVKEARKMVEDGKITLQKVDIRYTHDYRLDGLIGTAEGLVEQNGRTVKAEVVFGKGEIYYARCMVQGCYNIFDASKYSPGLDGLCVHETALLFLLEEYLKQNNPGDATDETALFLLDNYRNKHTFHTKETPDVSRTVFLEPRVENRGADFYVSFRIGSDKLYMVKDIPELVQFVENKGIMPLGKKNQVDFSVDQFEERSQKYYDFVRKCVREEQFRIEKASWGFSGGKNIKGSLELYGEKLDTFYELARGTYLPFKDFRQTAENKNEKIYMGEEALSLELEIQPDIDQDGVFHGILINGNLPELLEGDSYFYCLGTSSLNRISGETGNVLDMLTEMEHCGKVECHVGRRHMAEFYYRVLPELKKQVGIVEKDEAAIKEYLAPEARFFFRLDAQKGNITCEVKVHYGEEEYGLCTAAEPKSGFRMIRDTMREQEIEERILEIFPEKEEREEKEFIYHCGGKEDVVYQMLKSGVEELLRLGEVEATEHFRRMKIRQQPKITVGVSMENDLMNLSVFTEDMEPQELLDILHSYRRKKKYYRLRNGDFLNLESQNLENLSAMFDMLQVSPKEFVKGKMQIPAYRALYLDRMLEENDEIYAKRDRHFKNLIREFKTVKDSDYEIPDSLQNTMRGYQRFGFKWLRTVEQCGFGGILADDMGLGKTLQMISVLLAAKQEGKSGTSLIVTPASLVYNWQEEIARFAPELKTATITGIQAERQKKILDYSEWDVLITSYDLLKRDIDLYEGMVFEYQVIDEAQYIKNHTTAAAKAVKTVRSRHRFALTGTPIENRLSELWSIFDYLMPGFLYGYERFRKELELPITKNKEEAATRRLKQMVSPFILRRLKEEVLKDLPEKLEKTLYAKFDEKQQKIYDGQVVSMKNMLKEQSEDNFRKNKLQILAELTRIRQVCCDPSLCLENYNGDSAKREACLELIRNAIDGEHKMLIFSQFTSMLELLEADLKAEKIPYYKITGATSKENRLEYVRSFNEDSTPVFLISLKAGGTGLNLTGADIVIHYDPWWNLAVQNQATDRVHRIGQTKKVSVYKLIAKGTIEEKILHMQEKKKDLADEILSGETGGIVNMSKEDLLELL